VAVIRPSILAALTRFQYAVEDHVDVGAVEAAEAVRGEAYPAGRGHLGE
jgi:hypothetical protein